MLEEERDRGGEQKCPTPWYLLNIFRILYTIVLKFSVTILLSIWVKKTQNVKILFFFYQNYPLTPLVDAGVNKILLYFFLIPAFVIFPLFIFQIDVSSDVPRGIFILVYSYERPNFGILKRRYIFIYSNIFHRSYVSSFKTWVKFVFCFKVRLL